MQAAKNGIIHALDHPLVPPPPALRALALFPARFSTLLLAIEKAGLGEALAGLGGPSTFFAPSNAAFARLGARANAFLFNTPRGRKLLAALLRYHVVEGRAVYSDELYRGEQQDADAAAGRTRFHVDLPTLLDGAGVAVDVVRWGALVSIRVNHRVRVAVQDGIVRDGVVQVVDRVLLPPRKRGGRGAVADGEIDVEELEARLGGCSHQEQEQGWAGDL